MIQTWVNIAVIILFCVVSTGIFSYVLYVLIISICVICTYYKLLLS